MNAPAISVLIAESQAAVREAFAMMLDLQEEVTVVGAASTAREALNLAWIHQPDTILIDTQILHDAGFHMLEQLWTSVPNCRCIMLAPIDLPGEMSRAYEHGAWAYLSKDLPFSEIVRAIKQVHSGQRLIDPRVAGETKQSPLTNRETEVLRMVALMGTTAEIAKQMHLSHGTVDNYVSSILAKLGATNRAHAVIVGRENGWL